MIGRIIRQNSGSGHPKDDLAQTLVQIHKMADPKWWQMLTQDFGSGKIKMTVEDTLFFITVISKKFKYNTYFSHSC